MSGARLCSGNASAEPEPVPYTVFPANKFIVPPLAANSSAPRRLLLTGSVPIEPQHDKRWCTKAKCFVNLLGNGKMQVG